jgi:hypothetical protein
MAVMSRKVAHRQASRAILSFAALAHERSQRSRDESKQRPSKADAWTLFQIRVRYWQHALFRQLYIVAPSHPPISSLSAPEYLDVLIPSS